MKEFEKNLPTKRNSRLGGGILDNNRKPEDLKRFSKNRKQKQIIIGSIIAIVAIIGGISLYRSFAMYEEKQTFDVLKGTVPDFSTKDITLAFTIDDKTPSDVSFPNKDSGYIVEGVSCEDNVTATWNSSTWSLENIENKGTAKKVKCTVAFKTTKGEPILNGADPVLDKEGKLIPVKIEDKGVVTKVKPESGEWYSYENKQWANAVILANGKTEENYKVGAKIEESDIESYFVWIPKYKYRLFNLGNYTSLTGIDPNREQRIEIEFGLDNTKDGKYECATPMLDNGVQGASGKSGKCQVGNWMTHPAFLAFEGASGFWVGKFDTGYKGATNTNGAVVNSADASKLIIKPNQYSWRGISVGNAYKTAKSYKEELDSHMMKNTEWGAVAYLSHSKYGTCENGVCQKIRMNNNSNYVSGYAAVNEPTVACCGIYKEFVAVTPGMDASLSYNYTNNNSVIASTTGNYTGIYDMAGGAAPFVMQVMLDTNSKPILTGSDLTEEEFNAIDKKYYDVYKYNTNNQDFSNRILGDATGEMGPVENVRTTPSNTRQLSSWNNALLISSTATIPWIVRGGSHEGKECGPFMLGGGTPNGNTGFLVVLSPR